ncbi:zinc-ribbon domain-containing protein [Levilactobacillus tangyuanensis]|uniref:Zinc-ribbon domain-containing protein n=1 Tax=Levilactobacillus tangyuanensis TaxID=2486021 RepID=A0ABW1TNK5_9LACO|nr:zinc ribbon domain-containing protein [Levilactobacillus tangyuanensis]
MEDRFKFCPKCGTQVANDVAFCPKCGTNLTGEGMPDTTSQQDAPVPAKPEKSPNAALLITLGWISAVISLLFVPILFGAAGAFCGYRLTRFPGNRTAGVVLMVFAILFGVVGVIMGAIVGSTLYGS